MVLQTTALTRISHLQQSHSSIKRLSPPLLLACLMSQLLLQLPLLPSPLLLMLSTCLVQQRLLKSWHLHSSCSSLLSPCLTCTTQ
jgi:hypothetical protein